MKALIPLMVLLLGTLAFQAPPPPQPTMPTPTPVPLVYAIEGFEVHFIEQGDFAIVSVAVPDKTTAKILNDGMDSLKHTAQLKGQSIQVSLCDKENNWASHGVLDCPVIVFYSPIMGDNRASK
jgi:hypothetical protein